MAWIKPRYLWEDKDRWGTTRRYVVKPGRRKIRIYADPETPEFHEAYLLALDGVALPKSRKPEPIELAIDGSFRWLVERYMASGEFLDLDITTRTGCRNVLASCCLEPIEPGSPHLLDKMPLGKLTSAHVRMLRDRKREWPEAANKRIKMLRGVFKWALANDELTRRYPLTSNPARDVPSLKSRGGEGFHTWTIEEVEKFEKAHPAGTMARLALALLMFTGQRKSDVIRFGRQHVRREMDAETKQLLPWLRFTQHKNRNRKAVTLQLPIMPVLQAALDEAPCGDLTYLVNEYGKPFSEGGFGNRMRKWCKAAGLDHCSSHGLRKAGACIAAENGATDRQMMAIFGWSDPKMPAHYTRKAGQKKMAGGAMNLIIPNRRKEEQPLPLLDWSEKGGRIA